MTTREKIEFTDLPLSVYREIAAHLHQVEGVEVSLIPQSSESFDYNQSQIEGLWLEYKPNSVPQSRERVEQILAHYQSRYGFHST
jgi:hypothetical protein